MNLLCHHPLRRQSGRSLSAWRRSGTTLIELLVVIVIFLVGILAVVQIFPKGFQLLIRTRNNSVSEALGRDQVEWLKAHADQLPDQIIPVHYVNGLPVEDPLRNPYDLGPQGDAINQQGILTLAGTTVGPWQLYSGANSFRRIIGEGQRVPSPRAIGSTYYGGLMIADFGPVDTNNSSATLPAVVAYANDLSKSLELPQTLTQVTTQSVAISGTSFQAPLEDSVSSITSPYQYFVGLSDGSQAYLLLPTNSLFNRTYHLRISAYVGTAGASTRTDYPDISFTVPATTATDAGGFTPPLIEVPIATILQDTPGALTAGQSMLSVEYNSIQVAPQYNLLASGASFDNDPLEYELLDPSLGVMLFSPVGYSTFIERPGGVREPLEARIDYDVLDWRIIRQEFRVDAQQGLNGGDYAQFQLALQSLLVGTSPGIDGTSNGVFQENTSGLVSGLGPTLEAANSPENPKDSPTQNFYADNLMLIDMQTGGVVYEMDPNSAAQLVTVDKRRGLLTINGSTTGGNTGLPGYLLLPGTTTPFEVDLTNRSLRVLYKARENFSVNVLKASSSYSIVNTSPTTSPLAEGQCYVPTNPGTRIYFPKCDQHQKVTIDAVYYTSGGTGTVQELDSQDFVIEYPTTPDAVGLPCIDLLNVLPSSSNPVLSTQYGAVARNIKGASVIAQVLWNPAAFQLKPTGTTNITAANSWGQNWRRNTTQTYLQREDIK